jgi:phosphohistidine phosphatase
MQLLVIRHAPAEDRAEFARTVKDDAERPLTAVGVRKMRRAARGLRSLVPALDALAASPYVRAAQTAQIVSKAYDGFTVEPLRALIPDGSRPEILRWLRALAPDATVAIVGHESDLSELISWLLTGSAKARLSLGKGGACLIEYDGLPPARPGAGRMEWLLARSHLERLGA